jgi:hypothetical protein
MMRIEFFFRRKLCARPSMAADSCTWYVLLWGYTTIIPGTFFRRFAMDRIVVDGTGGVS